MEMLARYLLPAACICAVAHAILLAASDDLVGAVDKFVTATFIALSCTAIRKVHQLTGSWEIFDS